MHCHANGKYGLARIESDWTWCQFCDYQHPCTKQSNFLLQTLHKDEKLFVKVFRDNAVDDWRLSCKIYLNRTQFAF